MREIEIKAPHVLALLVALLGAGLLFWKFGIGMVLLGAGVVAIVVGLFMYIKGNTPAAVKQEKPQAVRLAQPPTFKTVFITTFYVFASIILLTIIAWQVFFVFGFSLVGLVSLLTRLKGW